MRRIGGDFEQDLSRESLETVLREAVTGIAIVSPHPDGVRLDYTNDAFFAIFGYTRDEYEELSADVRMNLFNQADFIDIVAKVNTQYEPGEIIQFEIKINKKGGEKAWALISTRKPRNASKEDLVFICNITDITDMKKLQMQIQEEKERYEIVEEISDNILFNYDVVADVFECAAKTVRGVKRRTRIEDAIETLTYGDIIDHRDVSAFIEALSNALAGKKINVFDARIINEKGDGVWHRIKFAVIYGDDGNALRFIGTLTDIDKEKKEKTRLISQAETDQLTGFLNKLSVSMRISELLKENPGAQGALLFMDIDDFKKLNDTYGHHEGDLFLKQFSDKLSIRFGAHDVLGRVGGEEFVLFVDGANLTQEAMVEKAKKTAEDVLKICHSVKLENVPEREFSCSIGISLRNVNGTTYTALYESADKAMYAVKKSGKNNYRFAE